MSSFRHDNGHAYVTSSYPSVLHQSGISVILLYVQTFVCPPCLSQHSLFSAPLCKGKAGLPSYIWLNITFSTQHAI